MKTHDFITRVEWEPENDKPDANPAIDEIVSGPIDSFHIERMSDGIYWMVLCKGDKRQVITIGANGRCKIVARTEAD